MHNALESLAYPTPLFPEGHPLRRLVRPTFDSIRRSMGSHYVSAIWVDSGEDPTRAGFRPSYDDRYGPGSVNVMPFIATWLSNAAPLDQGGNVAVLPSAIDRTIVSYMQEIGLCGAVEFVDNTTALKARARATGRKIYSIDDLGSAFDSHAVVGSELSRWLNAKDDLASISAYAPRERIVDMYAATQDDYRAVRGEAAGRIYLKTCNTESAGSGVFICDSLGDFDHHLMAIREHQRRHELSRTLVIQAELTGRNCNFQVFLDPSDRRTVQIVALTDQLVEADGKTYRGSINHPITAVRAERIGPVILDMVDRIWSRHPDAFGFLMCDYFERPDGITIYDPGIRPTGNTATAMALHLAAKLTGHMDHYVSNMHLRTEVRGLSFGRFAAAAGELLSLEHLARTGVGVLPWGWNDVAGFGVLIGIAPDGPKYAALEARIMALNFTLDGA